MFVFVLCGFVFGSIIIHHPRKYLALIGICLEAVQTVEN
jgi:hypothetical protein